MSDQKEMVSFLEDREITRQVDELAEREGTNRSAIIRRAIRALLFNLSSVPTSEKYPRKAATTK